jgi:hypothetical protein
MRHILKHDPQFLSSSNADANLEGYYQPDKSRVSSKSSNNHMHAQG